MKRTGGGEIKCNISQPVKNPLVDEEAFDIYHIRDFGKRVIPFLRIYYWGPHPT